jgi:hypothetical protein
MPRHLLTDRPTHARSPTIPPSCLPLGPFTLPTPRRRELTLLLLVRLATCFGSSADPPAAQGDELSSGAIPNPYSHPPRQFLLPAVLCVIAPNLLYHIYRTTIMSHSTTASDHSQTLPGSGAAPIDKGQFSKTFPRDFSRSCLILVQTYHEGKCSKSDAIKRLARLVIDELERASRAGDNIKEVSSVLCAYLEILNVFDKERAGTRQEAIVAREDWVEVAKGQVAATQKRGREDGGEPDHPAKHPIEKPIPFGRPVSLPDDLRLTHELRDTYRRDPADVKAILLGDPSRPEFPSDLWDDVLANKFIDFNQILSQIFWGNRIDGDDDWAYAWDKYEKAVLFAFPHRERSRAVQEPHPGTLSRGARCTQKHPGIRHASQNPSCRIW